MRATSREERGLLTGAENDYVDSDDDRLAVVERQRQGLREWSGQDRGREEASQVTGRPGRRKRHTSQEGRIAKCRPVSLPLQPQG